MEIIVRKPTAEEITTAQAWPIWSHEPASFPWTYSEQETCLILQGSVTVTTHAGQEVHFGAGDFVIFPQGLSCTWNITEAVRKHYKFG